MHRQGPGLRSTRGLNNIPLFAAYSCATNTLWGGAGCALRRGQPATQVADLVARDDADRVPGRRVGARVNPKRVVMRHGIVSYVVPREQSAGERRYGRVVGARRV